MTNKIQRGIYEHYKGKFYLVIDTARHHETLEEFIIYKALYETEFGDDALWIRPLAMFTENVMINGKEVPRFRLAG